MIGLCTAILGQDLHKFLFADNPLGIRKRYAFIASYLGSLKDRKPWLCPKSPFF
jgi:hypothetical protein